MNIKVKVEDMIYEVEIEDLTTLPVIAHIGDETFDVWPEMVPNPVIISHHIQRHPTTTGMQTNNKDRLVTAPLPGTITEVFVQPGKKVAVGDPLLVIEAMKMKNTIRSGRSGTIASIHVHPSETVKHHQPMIEFME